MYQHRHQCQQVSHFKHMYTYKETLIDGGQSRPADGGLTGNFRAFGQSGGQELGSSVSTTMPNEVSTTSRVAGSGMTPPNNTAVPGGDVRTGVRDTLPFCTAKTATKLARLRAGLPLPVTTSTLESGLKKMSDVLPGGPLGGLVSPTLRGRRDWSSGVKPWKESTRKHVTPSLGPPFSTHAVRKKMHH